MLSLWKCDKCKELLTSKFYYIKECQFKFCKECKSMIVKEGVYRCICGDVHSKVPTEIMLKESKSDNEL